MRKKSDIQIQRERDLRNEVDEIREMFKDLKFSGQALGVWYPEFEGFDANNPHENVHREIILKKNAIVPDKYPTNSHFPALSGYLDMVARWRERKGKESLTKEDIEFIAHR